MVFRRRTKILSPMRRTIAKTDRNELRKENDKFCIKGYFMEWYKITVTQADNKSHEILEVLTKKIQTVGGVEGIAVFYGGQSQDKKYNVYFSPQCAENHLSKALIDFYGGVPCDKPTKETEKEMSALFKSDDTWDDMIWHS